MDKKTSFLIFIDSIVQSALWVVLCFSIIKQHELYSVWYLVCLSIVGLKSGLFLLNQKIAFPGMLRSLDYIPNEKAQALTNFKLSDHLPIAIAIFVLSWLATKT